MKLAILNVILWPKDQSHNPRIIPFVPGKINIITGESGTGKSTLTWIIDYWVRRLGREPSADELEPLTRAYWEMGKHVSAATYLRAIEVLQRYTRRVAEFLIGCDVFLTPTVSTPPLPLGQMVSTDEDPLRSLEVSGPTVAYSGVIANVTGNPAMSVPLWWNDEGLPIGVHVLGRFGDEATLIRLAAQLEAAQPWADRRPAVHAARLQEP